MTTHPEEIAKLADRIALSLTTDQQALLWDVFQGLREQGYKMNGFWEQLCDPHVPELLQLHASDIKMFLDRCEKAYKRELTVLSVQAVENVKAFLPSHVFLLPFLPLLWVSQIELKIFTYIFICLNKYPP